MKEIKDRTKEETSFAIMTFKEMKGLYKPYDIITYVRRKALKQSQEKIDELTNRIEILKVDLTDDITTRELKSKIDKLEKEKEEIWSKIRNILVADDEHKRINALFELKNLYKQKHKEAG